MLHEIYPNFLDNSYQNKTSVDPEAIIFCFKEDKLLLKEEEKDVFSLPEKGMLEFESTLTTFTFLFRLNNTDCYLVNSDNLVHSDAWTFYEVGVFRTLKNKDRAWAISLAYQLHTWYSSNGFCNQCGHAMSHKVDERALECGHCGHVLYPKISPAIIVAILSEDRDKILLARNNRFRNGWFSLVAGYVDVGESLEETVVREVKEEVGIEVSGCTYYKSQPWTLSGSLMVGFIAFADENEEIKVDGVEISEAHWFKRDNLPPYPPNLSIAGEMIDKFKAGTLI